MKHYYQLVREYGKYDIEYTIYEARKDISGICIAAIPFVLVGDHPDEIMDTLEAIRRDIAKYPPVDKNDCAIFHETLWLDDDDYKIEDRELKADLIEYEGATRGFLHDE